MPVSTPPRPAPAVLPAFALTATPAQIAAWRRLMALLGGPPKPTPAPVVRGAAEGGAP
jgi:hypothetical protein